MRRKSERTASKKAKASPEKKVEKAKRTRTRRRKQSTSSDNDSPDEGSPVREVEAVAEPEKKPPQTPVKEDSPEEAQDQVWRVKASEGDVGEIQKLKICLTRPPSTPERVDRSPRSKRKHSRATSSSDTPSVEGVDEKKKTRHRSRRSARDKDDEKNQDSHEEDHEAESEKPQEDQHKSSNEVSQSESTQDSSTNEAPMSTTNEEAKDSESESKVESSQKDQDTSETRKEGESQKKLSDADTTVVSPKDETRVGSPETVTQSKSDNQVEETENIVKASPERESQKDENTSQESSNNKSSESENPRKASPEKEAPEAKEISQEESSQKESSTKDNSQNDNVDNENSVTESSNKSDKETLKKSDNESPKKYDKDSTNKSDNESSKKSDDDAKITKSPKRKRSESIEKSEILEIHADESKCESDNEVTQTKEEHKEDAKTPQEEPAKEKSSSEDQKVSNTEETVSKKSKTIDTENSKATNKTDVVESSDKISKETKERITSTQSVTQVDNKVKDADKTSEPEPQHSKVLHRSDSVQSTQESIPNGQPTPVVGRKRRWGSRSTKLTTQKSITISTDILKDIIPDVKPVEFDEVIEEKKHRRDREVKEKIDRPVLPKIVIDNTDNVEMKKELEEREKESAKIRDLASNRKISIIKENDSIITRPPSPPRNKQSCILYITNLVRPFTLAQLKNLLQRTGRIVENGFWIDRIKSKCFVQYETEDQAIETRHALHGVTWPVSNPKTLQVDFSTEEAFEKTKTNEETDSAPVSTIPGTVEDWLREQDMKQERGEMEKPWERKAATREWDLGKNDKDKEKDKLRRDERPIDKRRHRSPEKSPEPARKFKKKEEEAPAKLLDDLFRKTKTTPCIYWLPLSAETIAIKEEQRRQHMAEHERRLQELRRTHRRHYHSIKRAGDIGGTPPWKTDAVAWWSVLAAVVATATAVPMTLNAEDPISLPEFVSGQFAQRAFNGTWISDTEYTFTKSGEPGIYVFDASRLEDDVLVAASLMQQLNTNNPILSADRQYILAPSEVQQVYRYSTTARFALYEIATATVTNVANHNRLQLCIFGGGHSLAYVMDNNVYYLPEGRAQAIQITTDGIPGVYYNGHADWVYEEDVMYTGQATWFSTQGSYLAFATYDDTEVESYSYYYYVDKSDPDDLYPELVDLKYPKVGRKNPTVLLRVVNLANLVQTNTPTFITMAAPQAVTADHILGGVIWVSDNEIAMHWQNRRQNYAVLRICNVVTNVCEEEHRQESNGWIPLAMPRFSSTGEFFLSTRWSEAQADGHRWQHLFLSVRVNGLISSSSVTPGAFTVNNYVGMDEANLLYYYTRTVTDMPWQTQVHVTGAATGCLSCDLVLPQGGPCTWATATLSRAGRYMTITCSSPEEPSATFILDPRARQVLAIWENNAIVRDLLVGKARWGSIITTVPLKEGLPPAPVRLLLPPGLDVNDTNTKYAMVFYVYSGPNTNTVFNTFTVGYHSYLTTSRNIIYMLADGRGSGLKGQDILFSLNNALGTVEIEDHSVILKQVLDRYQFIDRERVGIWGHSYGGYATLLTLLHDDEKLFQCGVSGAPVTSWLYYNTMYTERYMGLPTAEDNLSGYEEGDVTLLAEKLRGHDFYLMHGNADDNVHYQNAAKLMRALQERNIPFEQMSYPDEAHSLVGVNLHRYNAMDRYWTRCLKL
ncbi:uncharacterized protein LOC142987103 [Anticarsia gemmatalis]|uniref:uncharacterized protein LOC142987103 n=1 Tax=Anticarsia gemmatalis TaxID=129554 RepID=UPI003F75BC37